MAAKIKLTKNELKKQKDALKRFRRYLPTLQLKKQQLQMEIRTVEQQKEEKRRAQEEVRQTLGAWIEVFGEPVDLSIYVKLSEVKRGMGNIAGVDIPTFLGLSYENIPWDMYQLSLWVDKGIAKLKEIIAFDIEVAILEEQVQLLSDELRITTQRVNLFEKVKIPETRENIRTINIYLGDQQTAAVVRGKMAKSNLMKAGGGV